MARVGVRIADLAVRRTGVGLAMAARAGGSARPRASSRGYPRGRRSEAVGEAREVARRREAASLRTLTAPHPQHRWRAERISSPPGHLPPPSRRPPHHPRSVSRSRRLCSMFACVRAMSCLCQLCRSSLDERLYRDMCVESCVRCAGARRCSSTSSYATYKVLTVGKVYRPSRTSSLHRRRSRPPQV